MKSIILLVITVAITICALGQSSHVSHFEGLFNKTHKLQSNKWVLKASLANPKQRLDSIVDAGEKIEFAYDNNANCTLETVYHWDSSKHVAWVFSRTFESIYNINGKDSLDIEYNWDNSTWEKEYKTIHKYNCNGKDSLDVESDWNSDTSKWESDSYKTEFTYTSNGLVGIRFAWSSYTSTWTNSQKYESTYDSNNNCVSEIDYDWDNSVWNPEFKYGFTFNPAYSIDDLIAPYSFRFGQNMLTKMICYKSYNSSTSIWTELEGEYTFYYSSVNGNTGVSIVADKGTLKALVRNGQLQVAGIAEGESIVVYNMQGIAIYNQKIMGNTVNINLPQAGLYIVSNGTQRIKLINGSL